MANLLLIVSLNESPAFRPHGADDGHLAVKLEVVSQRSAAGIVRRHALSV